MSQTHTHTHTSALASLCRHEAKTQPHKQEKCGQRWTRREFTDTCPSELFARTLRIQPHLENRRLTGGSTVCLVGIDWPICIECPHSVAVLKNELPWLKASDSSTQRHSIWSPCQQEWSWKQLCASIWVNQNKHWSTLRLKPFGQPEYGALLCLQGRRGIYFIPTVGLYKETQNRKVRWASVLPDLDCPGFKINKERVINCPHVSASVSHGSRSWSDGHKRQFGY